MRSKFVVFTALTAIAISQAVTAAGTEYYGKGYTIISAADDSSDLDAIIFRQLPTGTVGNALYTLLEGTGWRLAESFAADPKIYRLYNQPLAEQKQNIGPMPLDKALAWIAGDAWLLVVDPVNRLISFEVEKHYQTYIKPVPIKKEIIQEKTIQVTDSIKQIESSTLVAGSENLQTFLVADSNVDKIEFYYDFQNFLENTDPSRKAK